MKPYTFKPGWYYIGDPCYAVKPVNWMPLLEKSNYFNCPTAENTNGDNQWYGKYNKLPMFAAGTAYGDGEYFDQTGRRYAVDAGLIGIIPAQAADGNSMTGGNFVRFDKDFEVGAEDGFFQFGDIEIDTRDEEDDECPECGERECCCNDENEECEYCGDPNCYGECQEEEGEGDE